MIGHVDKKKGILGNFCILMREPVKRTVNHGRIKDLAENLFNL